MTGPLPGPVGPNDRFAEASAWFARMHGPDGASRDVRAAFETWRSAQGNAEAYAEMEAIWDLSARIAAGEVAAPRRPVRLRPGLIAAGIAAALTMGFLVWHGAQRSETASIYGSPHGQIRSFALADGSRVALDTGSRIAVDLGGEERRVTLLAGRARFSVAKDAAHPFVVLAGQDAVVARGTVFDVSLAGENAEVALYEGAVDLERRERHAPPRLLARLRPGQKALLAANDAAPAIAPARVTPWPRGVLAGENLRLADIVAEANRYGRARIVLADAALGDLRVSGGFKPADTQGLAALLAESLDLTVSRRDDGALVLMRGSPDPGSPPEPCAPGHGRCRGVRDGA